MTAAALAWAVISFLMISAPTKSPIRYLPEPVVPTPQIWTTVFHFLSDFIQPLTDSLNRATGSHQVSFGQDLFLAVNQHHIRTDRAYIDSQKGRDQPGIFTLPAILSAILSALLPALLPAILPSLLSQGLLFGRAFFRVRRMVAM